eukprot:g3827.t1
MEKEKFECHRLISFSRLTYRREYHFIALLSFLLLFCAPASALLPPGYEDKLFCERTYCKRKVSHKKGWVGPASAAWECAIVGARVGNAGKSDLGTGEIRTKKVTTWGTKDGEEKKNALLEEGYHERLCSAYITNDPVESASAWILGLTLAISGSLLSAVAKALLKVRHNLESSDFTTALSPRGKKKTQNFSPPSEASSKSSNTDKKSADKTSAKIALYLAITIFIITPVVDVAALKFAPESMVAATSGVTSVWNLIIGATFLQEPWSKLDVYGNLLLFIGCTGVGFIGSQEIRQEYSYDELQELYISSGFIVFIISIGIWLMLLFSLIRLPVEVVGTNWKKFAWGAVSGSTSGLLFFAKTALSLLDYGTEPWTHAFSYFMVIFAICSALGGIMLLNEGLRRYDSVFVTPVYQGMFIVVGSFGGAALFKELDYLDAQHTLGFFLSIVIICVGLYVIILASAKHLSYDQGGDHQVFGASGEGSGVGDPKKDDNREEVVMALPVGLKSDE